MLTCKDWHHIWLNEGFASYCEAQYYLKKFGWASYHSYMASMAYAGGGSIYIVDTTSVNIIFGNIVYDKAAYVLHMLRRVLGETNWAAAMNAWYNSPYKYKSATTEDFRDVVEAATGVNIHDFIQDWIYGTYRPNYNWTYWQEAAAGGGYNIYMVVNQTQTTNPQVFRMPVDFFMDYVSLPDDTIKLVVDQRKKLFKLHVDGSLTNIDLDPANWVLKYKTKVPWDMYIVSVDSDIHEGRQHIAYADTIQSRGGTGSNTWTILTGALPTGFSISNKGIISGTTTDTGTFAFSARVKDNGTSFADTATFSLRIAPVALIAGNVDMADQNVDIADLTWLIGYLYVGGPKPPVPATADVDHDCNIDISDITGLISYLYLSGPPLVLGCAP
jgi:hypothetical protein